jgi:myosin protein heavy chain
MDGRQSCQNMLQQLNLDNNQFRIGRSKVFFRAGVLADLEEKRDNKLSVVMAGFQAFCRGYLARRKFRRREDEEKCIRIIQRNARIYIQLREWAWWKLYSKVKPLLNVSRVDDELRRREEAIGVLQEKLNEVSADKDRLEEASRLLEEEKSKLQDILSSERVAAADQLNILNRAKSRESDLEEELKNLANAFEAVRLSLYYFFNL